MLQQTADNHQPRSIGYAADACWEQMKHAQAIYYEFFVSIVNYSAADRYILLP